jgi:hypothetical protein
VKFEFLPGSRAELYLVYLTTQPSWAERNSIAIFASAVLSGLESEDVDDGATRMREGVGPQGKVKTVR